MLQILNQLFDAQKKCENEDATKTKRNLDRMKTMIEQELNWSIIDPIGEPYNESRTDCDATLTDSSNAKVIIETLKPIVRDNTNNAIIQRAVVLV